MRAAVLLPALALLLAAAAPAIAAPLDKKEVQARKDFAAGRYEQAADAFAELFAQTADPIYLRNIGRCYQKLKRPQDAVSSFQEYLRKARNLSAAEREEIDGYIKEMEALQAAQQPPPPAPAVSPSEPAKEMPPPQSTTPPPAVTPPHNDTSPAAAIVVPPPATGDEAQTARSFRIAGITTGAAGIALLGTGLAFGLAAKSASDSVSMFWDPDKDRAGQRYETLQWVGYGLGAASLGTGIFLYLYGRATSEEKHASSWTVRTAFATDGGGMAVEGTF